ncbi:hypothetical protein P885DRAFT_47254 [Corynascus similis CBS 632.67]
MSDAQQSSPGASPPLPPAPEDVPHDSLQINIIVASTICWFIAAFFVALRLYTRGFIIRVLGWSDWSILLALIFSGATCGGVIEQAINGSGYHIWDLDPHDTASAKAWARAAWYCMLFYTLTIAFSKIAILLLYIHLFAFKWARTAGQVLLGIVIISHLYMTLVTFTACIPLQSYWDNTVVKKYCHPQSMWWSSTGLHMITDFLIFLLPMPVVWTIRLPRRQKIALSGIFGFGFVVCFISILRLLQLLRAQTDSDFTYVAAELSYMTAVETNGAIVCACVMTLKPLLARLFPRVWGSTGSSGARYTYASGSGSGSGRRYKRKRYPANGLGGGSDGFSGPPTIGSLPSKLRMGPLGAMERDVKRVWVDGGYVELEDKDGDIWEADVELVETVRGNVEVERREASAGTGEQASANRSLGQPQRPPPIGSGKVRVDTEVRVQVSKVRTGIAL